MANNEGTREQIQRWIEKSIKDAENPDPRDKMRLIHKEKGQKVVKRYGF